MNTIELKVEELIRERECICICDIIKQIGQESKDLIRVAVSTLVVRHAWSIKHEAGRVFIRTQRIVKSTTVNHRKEGVKAAITAKIHPADGDWVVTAIEGSSERMFFDGSVTSDEARSTYIKNERNVKYHDTRIRRYHKLETFKTMHNFIPTKS
jgi:hypothetical protein